MQGGISVEWRTKMKSGVSKITGEPFDDSMLGLFLESFVDNSFQKLDLLKVLIWANTGLIFINSLKFITRVLPSFLTLFHDQTWPPILM